MTNLRMRISPSGPLDGSSPNVSPFGQFGGDQYLVKGCPVGDAPVATSGETSVTLYEKGKAAPKFNARGQTIDGVRHVAFEMELNQQGIPPVMSGSWTAGSAVEVEAVLCLGFATSGGPTANRETAEIVALPFFYDAEGNVRSTQNADGTDLGCNPNFNHGVYENNQLFFKAVTRPAGNGLSPALTVIYSVEVPEGESRGNLFISTSRSTGTQTFGDKVGNSITFRRIR